MKPLDAPVTALQAARALRGRGPVATGWWPVARLALALLLALATAVAMLGIVGLVALPFTGLGRPGDATPPHWATAHVVPSSHPVPLLNAWPNPRADLWMEARRDAWPDFRDAGPVSVDVRRIAEWVASTRDNGPRAFVIVDKRAARVHVFDHHARWRADAPALLGAVRGDHGVRGAGDRPTAPARRHERTTPAGRYLATPGTDPRGEDVAWLGDVGMLSMHRVQAHRPAERRLERLASARIDDNRISDGGIGVPAAFYDRHVKPCVHGRHGALVYVLPEEQPLETVFALPPPRARAATPVLLRLMV